MHALCDMRRSHRRPCRWWRGVGSCQPAGRVPNVQRIACRGSDQRRTRLGIPQQRGRIPEQVLIWRGYRSAGHRGFRLTVRVPGLARSLRSVEWHGRRGQLSFGRASGAGPDAMGIKLSQRRSRLTARSTHTRRADSSARRIPATSPVRYTLARMIDPDDLEAMVDAELRRRAVPPFRPRYDLIVCRGCGRRIYDDDGRPVACHGWARWWQAWRSRGGSGS